MEHSADCQRNPQDANKKANRFVYWTEARRVYHAEYNEDKTDNNASISLLFRRFSAPTDGTFPDHFSSGV
jgi:hypothetical protein